MSFENPLSEKELLSSLLNLENQLSIEYNCAINESSCPQLRKIFLECLLDILDTQYLIFDALDRRGWNKINLVDKKEIQSTVDEFSLLLRMEDLSKFSSGFY